MVFTFCLAYVCCVVKKLNSNNNLKTEGSGKTKSIMRRQRKELKWKSWNEARATSTNQLKWKEDALCQDAQKRISLSWSKQDGSL